MLTEKSKRKEWKDEKEETVNEQEIQERYERSGTRGDKNERWKITVERRKRGMKGKTKGNVNERN